MPRLVIDSLVTHHVGPLTFELEAGECLALSGPSGAGKSLLLRAIADLDPHEGEVRLDGQAMEQFTAPEWRQRVGLLPAESRWWLDRVSDHMPGLDAEPLARLGLPADALGWRPERCSTGERQRLALLRLLANRPSVLLLDEPTASLDGESVERVERLVAAYRAESGAAVIWVSHDPRQIERVAGRRLRIEAGRIAA